MEEKKGKLLFYFLLVLIYLIGAAIVLVNRPKVKNKVLNSNLTATPAVSKTEYKVNPPSEALSGILNIVNKTIEKLPRFSEDWEKVATTAGILQEEKIRTDEKGKAEISFANQVSIKVNPLSEINFASLLPDSFLIEQITGTATYTIEKPISVKSVDTLTMMQPGKLTLEMDNDNGFIYMTIASGSGKFSFIDNDNQTQVYEIKKGNRVIYNPKNTSITIR